MTTMNCRQARTLLMAYLDSELDAGTTIAVGEHLARCATCRDRFDREERLEAALGAELRKDPMPDDVWDRVRNRLGPRTAARRRWLAAAAAAIVLLAAWFVVQGPAASSDGEHDLTLDMLTSHARFRSHAAEPRARDRDAVRAMLARNALDAFVLPEDGTYDVHPVRLMGAELLPMGDGQAVDVLFECCGVVTSVFVLSRDGVDRALLERLPSVPTRHDELTLETVRRGDVVLSVVAEHEFGLLDTLKS